MTEYVGMAMPRYDGIGQVKGQTKFVDDFVLPGMLYAKAVRSPVHKGIIRKIDLSAAEKVPGVIGFVTADDIPGAKFHGACGDQPVLADEYISYKGEDIALVVAVDEDTCQEALEKVKLDIEEQEPVFDMYKAMKPDAPLVRPNLKSNIWEYEPGMTTRTMYLGDVEKGFEEADHIVEGSYRTGEQDHGAMEPMVSVAYFDDAGRLAIHTHSQCLYFQLGQLAGIFDLPMSQIRYIGGVVGGGFGGKNHIHADHFAGLAAIKFRRPVKYRLTRREDLLYSTKRGVFDLKYKTGVKKDGRITANHIKLWHDAGAFGGFSPYGVEKCSMFASGPYHIPNLRTDGQCVLTNKLGSSSMRGFTIMNGQFPMEMQMTKIAETLGMDQWELRFINAWRDGDQGVSRYVVRGAGALEAMKGAAELAGVELPENLLAMSSRGR
ncbi:MAG: molybdopterin-dependent oxidoreductase [Anaerolineae bacterium]|jgi:CO/xanthine dehydrogenase Mo-binding subunit